MFQSSFHTLRLVALTTSVFALLFLSSCGGLTRNALSVSMLSATNDGVAVECNAALVGRVESSGTSTWYSQSAATGLVKMLARAYRACGEFSSSQRSLISHNFENELSSLDAFVLAQSAYEMGDWHTASQLLGETWNDAWNHLESPIHTLYLDSLLTGLRQGIASGHEDVLRTILHLDPNNIRALAESCEIYDACPQSLPSRISHFELDQITDAQRAYHTAVAIPYVLQEQYWSDDLLLNVIAYWAAAGMLEPISEVAKGLNCASARARLPLCDQLDSCRVIVAPSVTPTACLYRRSMFVNDTDADTSNFDFGRVDLAGVSIEFDRDCDARSHNEYAPQPSGNRNNDSVLNEFEWVKWGSPNFGRALFAGNIVTGRDDQSELLTHGFWVGKRDRMLGYPRAGWQSATQVDSQRGDAYRVDLCYSSFQTDADAPLIRMQLFVSDNPLSKNDIWLRHTAGELMHARVVIEKQDYDYSIQPTITLWSPGVLRITTVNVWQMAD